jgi:hypothetical protein
MYGQFDLKAISKTFKKMGKTPNFHEFWSEELYYKERPQKKFDV